MARVQVAPSLDKITVDYDASRLMKKDVEAVLAKPRDSDSYRRCCVNTLNAHL